MIIDMTLLGSNVELSRRVPVLSPLEFEQLEVWGLDIIDNRDLENVIEQHSLGLVGIFRLFLDKLCQPYKENKKYQ